MIEPNPYSVNIIEAPAETNEIIEARDHIIWPTIDYFAGVNFIDSARVGSVEDRSRKKVFENATYEVGLTAKILEDMWGNRYCNASIYVEQVQTEMLVGLLTLADQYEIPEAKDEVDVVDIEDDEYLEPLFSQHFHFTDEIEEPEATKYTSISLYDPYEGNIIWDDEMLARIPGEKEVFTHTQLDILEGHEKEFYVLSKFDLRIVRFILLELGAPPHIIDK